MPICYTWIDWLQSSSMEAIGATSALQLARQAASPAADRSPPSPRTAQAPQPICAPSEAAAVETDGATEGAVWDGGGGAADRVVMQLMLYDAARDFKIFQEVRPAAVAACLQSAALRICQAVARSKGGRGTFPFHANILKYLP